MSLIPINVYVDYINSGTEVQDTSSRVQPIQDYVEAAIQDKQCKQLCLTQTQSHKFQTRYGFSHLINPFVQGEVSFVKVDGNLLSGYIDSGECIYLPDVIDNGFHEVEIGVTQNLSLLSAYFVSQCLEAQAYIWRLGEKQQIQLTTEEYIGGLKISFDKYIGELVKNVTKRIIL